MTTASYVLRSAISGDTNGGAPRSACEKAGAAGLKRPVYSCRDA
jgi:hypothetical protein